MYLQFLRWFEKLNLAGCMKVVPWMDCARHWRGCALLESVIMILSQKYRTQIELSYGCEQHFEMVVDGFLIHMGG